MSWFKIINKRVTLLSRMGKLTEAEQDLSKAKALAQQELEQKTH